MKKSLKQRIERLEAELKSRAQPAGYWRRLADEITVEELAERVQEDLKELEASTDPQDKADLEAWRLHEMSSAPGYLGPYYPPPESDAQDLDDEALAKSIFDLCPELLERCKARVAAKVAV